jgi:50S ribosomal protein L16 3-hydroxylase
MSTTTASTKNIWCKSFWRRHPTLFRDAVSQSLLVALDKQKISEWVCHLDHIRVFLNDPRFSIDNVLKSRDVPRSDASVIFDQLTRSTLRFTVFMNHVDQVDEHVRTIRKTMNVPFAWRVDDIVATYSSVESGVGYHAGHEDAFVVQVAGQRLWHVWDSKEIDYEARRRILISAPDDIYPFQGSAAPPILSCTLNPGDVLYIPPFFPHEGKTMETSISIALGWRGVAYFHLVYAFPQLIESAKMPMAAMSDEFFELLPDFDVSGGEDAIDRVVQDVIVKLQTLGCTIREEGLLKGRLKTLLLSSGEPIS